MACNFSSGVEFDLSVSCMAEPGSHSSSMMNHEHEDHVKGKPGMSLYR